MADDPLSPLKQEDSHSLNPLGSRFDGSLKQAYTQGSRLWVGADYTFERFAEFCLEWAAVRSKNSERVAERLEDLLAQPDFLLCCALSEGFDTAYREARERFGPVLADLHASCDEAYPRIGFPKEEFEVAVLKAASRRCLRRGFPLEEALHRGMTFPDFYLAAAVLSGEQVVAQRAGDVFTQKYFPFAQSYVRKRWSSVPEASDRVSALFFCALYPHTISEKTGNPNKDDSLRPPLLSDYRGQGPLAAWLTLTLGNMIRDSIRTSKQTVSIDEEREIDAEGSRLPMLVLSSQAGQREGIDRSKCVRMLRSGLERAWKTLKPREQLTLVMQTLMEVPPSLIARRVFHVHEGTITKYTTAALKKIKEGLEAYAREEARMESKEIKTCFEFMREAFPETETLAGGIVRAASES